MPERQTKKPELLAPAGSLEAFFAAMEFGADAVYVGLKEFSARAKAKNVNRDELERMVGYAHARRRHVFLTINTLIKEKELSHLIDVLAAVEAIGVDAVILQDLGVWRLARRHFPGLPLHASTQMTLHNTAGVQMAERMGFSRVVLARELSLMEIAEIRQKTAIDLEHFVHGAHCFSLSGQCSFSSWLGGMGGNRGRCAQPCRRRYHHKGNDGYYFSPNDLSAIDLLPELADAGIMSFKIEGRMKSAEYVANVVQAYRMAIDAAPAARRSTIAEAKELLKDAFGRLPTRGFLPDAKPTDMVNPGIHGATGRLIGQLDQCQEGRLHFTSRDALHLGDRLRIQPASDKPGTAFTIRDLRHGHSAVTRVNAGQRVSVGAPPGKRFRSGDGIYKVASGQAFNLSTSACRKRLEEVVPGEAMVDIDVLMPNPQQLELKAFCQGLSLKRTFSVETFPAEQKPLAIDVLNKVFGKTGDLPLTLGELRCGELPAVVLPLSRLNAIRREFYRELADCLTEKRDTARTEHRRQAVADLVPRGPRSEEPQSLTVGVGSLHELPLLRQAGVDTLILPLVPGSARKLLQSARSVFNHPETILWDLPLAIFDAEWPAFESEIDALYDLGFRRFRLQNLGQQQFFEKRPEAQMEAGYRLFTTNSQAALAWQELGFAAATLYVEDDRDNLAALLDRRLELSLSITVYANLPMMISRIPLATVSSDRPVISDRGETYRVDNRGGMTTIRPEQDFSLLGHLQELRRMGCRRFVVDLSHLGRSDQRRILAAVHEDREVAETSTFNYLQEMV